MEFPESKTMLPQYTISDIANAIPIWDLLKMTEKEYYEKYHKTEEKQKQKEK